MKKLLVVVAAVMAGVAFAEGPAADAVKKEAPRPVPRMARAGMRPQMSMEPVVRAVLDPKVAEKIGLTAEQREKLQALKAERADSRALQQKMRDGMKKQSDLLAAEKIDEAAVMAAIDEVWDARKEMAKEQTRRVIAVKSILTPDQVRQALEAVRAQRPQRRPPAKAPVAPAAEAKPAK